MRSRGREDLERLERLRLGSSQPYSANHSARYLVTKTVLEQLGTTEILVVGCGRGVLEAALPATVRCVSIDVSESALAVARKLNAELPGREFHQLDLFDIQMGLARRKFPAAVVAEVIEHLAQDVEALRAVGRCLVPGGRLVLTVPNRQRLRNRLRRLRGREAELMDDDHVREYTIPEIRDKLILAGFRPVTTAGIHIELPRDYTLRPLLPPLHPMRFSLARLFPGLAQWLLLVAVLVEGVNGGQDRAGGLGGLVEEAKHA